MECVVLLALELFRNAVMQTGARGIRWDKMLS
jgi:hypothetical protein